MPNYCDYGMIVTGYKDNVNEFIKIIQANYNYNKMEFTHTRHLFRIFDAQDNIWDEQGLLKSVEIAGYCAWSVVCCMMPGELTYYNDLKQSFGDKFRGTNLINESKRLKLQIEVYSEEPGMCFREHYVIINGVLCKEECDKLVYVFTEDFESYNEFFNAYKNLPDVIEQVNEERFNIAKEECNYISIGDVPWEYNNIHIAGNNYSMMNIMCKKI